MTKEAYYQEMISQIPRILGLLNRNKESKLYGCFDREYWSYKRIDFPCAKMQEGVLILALVYTINREDNPYYKNEKIYEWIIASLKFTASIQNKDGSFNETYPNDHHYITTSQLAYCVSEACILLGIRNYDFDDYLTKARRWLINNKEIITSNQEAGGILALYNISAYMGDMFIAAKLFDKLTNFLETQNEEGWFIEYGGVDIGYLSLTINFLAKLYQKTGNEILVEPLESAINFISYFVHPDGTFGGNYSSRNTQFMLPDGFEIMADKIPMANSIANAIKNAIKNKTSVTPNNLDDRYLLSFGSIYLQAYLNCKELKITKELPYEWTGNIFFKECRLKIIHDDYYTITNLNNSKKQNYEVVMASWKFIILRISNITFGKINFISLMLKKYLRKKIISNSSLPYGASSNYFEKKELKMDKLIIEVTMKKIIDWVRQPYDEENQRSGDWYSNH